MEIVHELLKDDEISEFSQVVITVVNEFSKIDYDEDGYIFVINYASPEQIYERKNISNFFVAKYDRKIIGTLEIMNPGNIIYDTIINDNGFSLIYDRERYILQLFFIEKIFQHKGIGKELLKFAIEYLRSGFPEKKIGIYVHSSTYAEKIYESLGFNKIADIQNIGGVKYFPMVYLEENKSE